jgi:hypothetical protein
MSYSFFVLFIELSHHRFQQPGMPALDAFVTAASQRTADLFCSTDKFLGHLPHKLARTLFAAAIRLTLQLPFFVISRRLGAPNFPVIGSTFSAFIGFVHVDHPVEFRQVGVLKGVHHAVKDSGPQRARVGAEEPANAALDSFAFSGSHGFLLSEVFTRYCLFPVPLSAPHLPIVLHPHRVLDLRLARLVISDTHPGTNVLNDYVPLVFLLI